MNPFFGIYAAVTRQDQKGFPAGGWYPAQKLTLTEAIRCAFEQIAAGGHPLVVLDDLQWSDEATLELLAAFGNALEEMPLLVIAAYRSDGLPRDHLLRWLRNELRRSGRLAELALAPLDREETAQLLAELLEAAPAPSLVAALHDRTEGVPFFVEELAHALRNSGRLQPGPRGLELGGESDVPVPATKSTSRPVRTRKIDPCGEVPNVTRDHAVP